MPFTWYVCFELPRVHPRRGPPRVPLRFLVRMVVLCTDVLSSRKSRPDEVTVRSENQVCPSVFRFFFFGRLHDRVPRLGWNDIIGPPSLRKGLGHAREPENSIRVDIAIADACSCFQKQDTEAFMILAILQLLELTIDFVEFVFVCSSTRLRVWIRPDFNAKQPQPIIWTLVICGSWKPKT